MTVRRPKNWGRIKPSVEFGIDWSDPINQNLISCWLVNEAAGNTLFDIAKNKNNGTLTNSPSWKPGAFGTTLSCGGTNQGVLVPSSASLQSPSSQVTICAWSFVPTTVGNQGNFASIAGKDYQTAPRGGAFVSYQITAAGSGTQNYQFTTFASASSNDQLSSGVAVIKGVPKFICGVMNGATKTIYIDGVSKATNANGVSLGYNNGKFSMGTNSASGEPYIGYIDAVRVWGRALKQTEIFRLYTEPFAGILSPRRRLWNGAAAGGGATFNPGWASGATRTIGGVF